MMKLTAWVSSASGISYVAQPPSTPVRGHGRSQAIWLSTSGATALPHMCRPQPLAGGSP